MRGLALLGALLCMSPLPALAQAAAGKASVWSTLTDYMVEYEMSETLLRRATPTHAFYELDLDADYPLAARRARSGGIVTVHVTVGPDDRVTRCIVVEPVPDTRLNAAACAIITRRGKFVHALSRDGEPVADTVSMDVGFDIDGSAPLVYTTPAAFQRGPGRDPAPIDPQGIVMRGAKPELFPNRDPAVIVDIDETGTVTRCGITTSVGSDAGDIKLCAYVSTVRFTPEYDSRMRPVAARAWRIYPKLMR